MTPENNRTVTAFCFSSTPLSLFLHQPPVNTSFTPINNALYPTLHAQCARISSLRLSSRPKFSSISSSFINSPSQIFNISLPSSSSRMETTVPAHPDPFLTNLAAGDDSSSSPATKLNNLPGQTHAKATNLEPQPQIQPSTSKDMDKDMGLATNTDLDIADTSPVTTSGHIDDKYPPQTTQAIPVTVVFSREPILRKMFLQHILETLPQDTKPAVITKMSTNNSSQSNNSDDNGSSNSTKSTQTEANHPSVADLALLYKETFYFYSDTDQLQLQQVFAMVTDKDFNYILYDAGGDDPATFHEPLHMAKALQAIPRVKVDSLVSIINGETALVDLNQDEASSVTAPQDQSSPHAFQILSLVEYANVIVLARQSFTPPDDFVQVENLLSVLNLDATILSSVNGKVPCNYVIGTNLYDPAHSPTVNQVLNATKGGHENGFTALPKEIQESTFLYEAKRPFHPLRLYKHIREVTTFEGVVRSFGYLWLATRMNSPLVWNQVGHSATLREGDPFLVAFTEHTHQQRVDDSASSSASISNTNSTTLPPNTYWDDRFGDRQTKMVFVGNGIDKEKLENLLDSCVLMDEEIVFSVESWASFEDPFLKWVPISHKSGSDAMEQVSTENNTSKNSAELSSAENGDRDTDQDELGFDEDLDEDFIAKVTALDIFAQGGYHTQEDDGDQDQDIQNEDQQGKSDKQVAKARPPIFQQDRSIQYDESKVIIASGDKTFADEILQQIPTRGIPVTLVTGFLGSGKTTLLNYILTQNHGLKIACLVNEFGEVDIDNQIVEKGDWDEGDEVVSEEMIELSNGCICCSINGKFMEALKKIIARADKVDYIIIETTGIADPVPIINTLMDKELDGQVRLDGILTLVDVENFEVETNMNSEAAFNQISVADTILLSKTDLVSEEQTEKIARYVRYMRPSARVLRSQRGKVPLKMILDMGVRLADDIKQEHAHDDNHHCNDPNCSDLRHKHENDHEHSHDCGDPNCLDPDHKHAHDHNHDCSDPNCTEPSHKYMSNHVANDGFMSTSFKTEEAFDAELFLTNFLQRLPHEVYRSKGVMYFEGFPEKYIFQLSGRRYEFEEQEWKEGEKKSNQLVVIGRDLDLEEMRSMIQSCVAQKAVIPQ